MSLEEVVARIDAAIGAEELCACGCGKPVRPSSRSPWFADEACQERFQRRLASEAGPMTVLPPESEPGTVDADNPVAAGRAFQRAMREMADAVQAMDDAILGQRPTNEAENLRRANPSIGHQVNYQVLDEIHQWTQTEKRVLFIDGPLAGRLQVLPRDVWVWRTTEPPPPISVADYDLFDGSTIPMPQTVDYHPVRGGSQHHDPQPWTCKRPPTNDSEFKAALAQAWYLLHGPSSQRRQS